MNSLRTAAQRLGLLSLVCATAVSALDFDICADINTSGNAKNISIFQTNGLCHDFCIDDWAYAITQTQGCWCSNYTPDKSNQVNDNRCNTPCPAFPEERCGGDGVFGYLLLNKVLPSGTKSGTPSPTTDSGSSTSPPESLIISTVTDGGKVSTVTVPANPSGTGDPENVAPGSSKKGGLATGAIVGIVIGVLGAVAIAAGLAFWFLRRRKRMEEEKAYQGDPSVRGNSPGSGGGTDMGMTAGSPSIANTPGNRSSTLQIDPRMDPFRQGLYARNGPGSRESLDSLRDDHDYSRRIQQPLRATNPDPDVD